MLQYKSIQAAEVIAMTVAENQTIDRRRIDVEQIEVPVEDLRRVAKVEQVLRFGAGLNRAQVQ